MTGYILSGGVTMQHFTDSDDDYMLWIAAHPSGFVVNVDKAHSRKTCPMVHHATHKVLTTSTRENYTTGDYYKVCSGDLDELESWSVAEFGRSLTRCKSCMRPFSRSDPAVPEILDLRMRFMPKTIVVAASRVRQGALVLYTTSMKVRDLVSQGFYNVETLDPDNSDDKGFQRLLNKARAKKLADYIVKGQDSHDAFLPTSVFLATDKSIAFSESTNTIEIDIGDVGPFSVVDGQHRLEGLKMAAEKDKRVLDFEVPVNIAINLPKIAQMCHFLIVNTTQKSVDKSVEQRIIARLSEALDVEDDLPNLPKWILNTVEKGEVEKAIKYVDYLNEDPDSPWFGKIKMANSDSDSATVNQRSFVKAIVKYVLTANNPLAIVKDFDKERKIFLNYWKAVATVLDDGNSTVLFKYNGVELFCKFSIPFFIKLHDRGNFKVSTMEALLRSCFDNVEGDYAGVGHPDWWAKGGKASFLNAGAINVVSQEMTKALHKSSASSAIEL